MKHKLFIPIVTFVAGAGLALGLGVILLRQQPDQTLSLVGAKPSATPTVAPKLEVDQKQQHRLDLSRDFEAVIQDTAAMQGWELDQYAFNDLISINQNTLGLLKKISIGTNEPRLKTLVEQIQTQRQTEIDALNSAQAATGHSKHLH